jgi:hypothetical protein
VQIVAKSRAGDGTKKRSQYVGKTTKRTAAFSEKSLGFHRHSVTNLKIMQKLERAEVLRYHVDNPICLASIPSLAIHDESTT